MAGIFGTQGFWSCGFDFMPTGSNLIPSGIFDSVGANWTVNTTFARFGIGKGAQCSGATGLQRTLNVNLASMYTAFGFQTSALPGSGARGLCQFNDTVAGTPQFGLCYDSTGAVQFYKTNPLNNISAPSNPIGTPSAAGVVSPNTYMQVETFTLVNPTTGTLTIRINGTQVATFTGNTRTTANSWINQVTIGEGTAVGGNILHTFDDFYMLDGTAPAPMNGFLGVVRIQTDGPNNVSATAGLNQWTPTNPQGTDYGNNANIPANTAQYNSAATVGLRMSNRFPSLTQLIYALNMWYSAEVDAAGTGAVTPIFRNNGVDQAGTATGNLNQSYTYYNQPCTIDPATGHTWASEPQGVANLCEAGLQRTS